MVRKRGVARKSFSHRRVRRVQKYDHHVLPRRFKIYLPNMTNLLPPELKVHVECEDPTMALLQSLGVPTEEWQYYLGFMKRMIEFYQSFTSETLQMEKDSLIAEYVLRGKDKDVLEQVQEVAAECAGFPPVPPFTCDDVKACLEGDFTNWTVYDRVVDSDVQLQKGYQGALVNGEETDILMMDEATLLAKHYNIAAKTLTQLAGADHDFPCLFTVPNWVRAYSVLGTYAVSIIENKNGIRIYKDGVVIKSLTPADLGIDAGYVESVDISRSGKYVVVSGYLTVESDRGWVILEGN